MTSMTLHDLSKKMKNIDFGMLTTRSGAGRLSSRPMSNNGDVEYDGDSWFFSYEATDKVADIRSEPGVSLTFTGAPSLLGKPGIFISIEGSATLIGDKATFAEHWTSDLDRWFPQGVDTPGIVMIKVQASRIEYWDGEENGVIAV